MIVALDYARYLIDAADLMPSRHATRLSPADCYRFAAA